MTEWKLTKKNNIYYEYECIKGKDILIATFFLRTMKISLSCKYPTDNPHEFNLDTSVELNLSDFKFIYKKAKELFKECD